MGFNIETFLAESGERLADYRRMREDDIQPEARFICFTILRAHGGYAHGPFGAVFEADPWDDSCPKIGRQVRFRVITGSATSPLPDGPISITMALADFLNGFSSDDMAVVHINLAHK